jgi:signal transduction histidine kinase
MSKVVINQLFNKSTKRVRILGGIFAIVIAVTLFSYYIAVVSPATTRAFSGSGSGSEDDPYLVTNCEQLQSIGDVRNGYNYVFTNDIDCSDTVNWNNGAGFKPIADYFSGEINGRNHEIKNLYINRPTTYAVGLFSYIQNGAIISNIRLTKSPEYANRIDINGGRSVGSIAGEHQGNTIKNVHSSLNVQSNGRSTDGGNDSAMSIGGLVGINYRRIERSSSTGNIAVADNDLPNRNVSAGGLVGAMNAAANSTYSQDASIDASFATGNITSGVGSRVPGGSCGGLAGVVSAIATQNSGNAIVKHSYSTGNVVCNGRTGVNVVVGGFVGTIVVSDTATLTPLFENNFTVSNTTGTSNANDINGFYGVYYKGVNSIAADVNLFSNKFDATRTGSTTCGNSTLVTCDAVNINNADPDYFSSSNATQFYENWNQQVIWTLTSTYPVHKQVVVRPDSPLNLNVIRSNDDFILSWETPSSSNGRFDNIRYYDIFIRDDGNRGLWQKYQPNTLSTDTTRTISGLSIPGKYSFRVRATSDAPGYDIHGLYSASIVIATGMPAIAPVNIQLIPGARSATASWEPVEAATAYQVQYRPQGTTEWLSAGSTTTTSLRVIKLNPSTSYDFRVVARNIAGNGPWSESINFSSLAQQTYLVSNCQQLQNITNDLDGIYTQTANIDCSSIPNFVPIGNVGGIFQGSYNGSGFTISNVTISSDIEAENSDWVGVGLFGAVADGSLTNIFLRDSTIVGNYKLSDSIDSDGNGLPDQPDLPPLPFVGQDEDVSTTINDDGEIVQENNSSITEDEQESSGNASSTVNQYGSTALQYPGFSVGAIAGSIYGTGEYSNIKALNTVVQGSTAGGVFGSVIPSEIVKSVILGENEDPQTVLLASNGVLTLSNIQSSGMVNGFIAGGIVGIGISSLGGVIGLESNITIANSSSSSDVDANIGGGLLGLGLASVSFSVLPVILQEISNGINPQGSPALIAAVNSTLNTQGITIQDSNTSGSVSTCNAASEVRVGALGGIVGIAAGTLVKSSQSTGEVTVCSASPENRLAYGGVMGGVGGLMVSSRIENTIASGDIRAIRNTGEYENESSAYLGIAGGLAGLFLDARNDLDGSFSILNNTSSGVIDIYGKNGLFSVTGGAIGLNIGNTTIKNTKSSRDIITATAQENIGALTISGGMTGLTLGLDGNFFGNFGADLNTNVQPRHGADIDNSYATGDIITVKNGKSGMLAITGGMTGLFVGSGTVSNSQATGNVSSTIPSRLVLSSLPSLNTEEDPNALSASLAPVVVGTNFGTAISGGLVGSAYGVDSARILTVQIAIVGGISPDKVRTLQGFNVTNSFASGNVQGNIAGGLMGSAEFKVAVEKTYASGNVRAEIAGGLVGQSGLVSTIGTGASLFLANLVTSGGFNQPTGEYEELGAIFDANLQAFGPVSINNTYATGNITAASYIIDVTEAFGANASNSLPILPVRFPTIAGGIMGLNMAPSSVLKNSYSSGSVTVLPLPERSNNFKIGDIPSFAGGIFGIHLAYPVPSVQKILADTGENVNQPPDLAKFMTAPPKLENVFSVSKLNLTNKTFTGGTSGLFFSPLTTVNTFLFGVYPTNANTDKFFQINNVYFDGSKVEVDGCNGPNTQPSTIARNILKDSYIPDSEGNNSVPTLPEGSQLTPESVVIEAAVNAQFLQTACQFVNNNNQQPEYFKNNKVNAPLNSWDFNDVWVVRKDDYPRFVAGVNTKDPDPPVVDDPERPPNPPKPPTATTTTTTTTPIPAITKNDLITGFARNNISRFVVPNYEKGQVKGFKTLLSRVPPYLAKSIPYLFILLLLMLATLYAWQALREYYMLRIYHKNIMQILATKESVDSYLAITTHYLATPVAIMNGAVELLESLKKVTAARADALKNKIKKLEKDVEQLQVANQVSNAQAANDDRFLKHKQKNPLKVKEVWIPALIALGLITVANVLFVYAEVFNTSPFRIAIEIGLFMLSVVLVALAYKYRDFLRETKEIARLQWGIESNLYKKRLEFIPQASKVTADNLETLQITSKTIKVVPEAKLFFNGLAMLEGINTSLQKINSFATFRTDSPLFDLTSYAYKATEKLQTSAKDKNISIMTNVDAGLVTRIQPDEIRHIVESLLDNAIKFGNNDGTVTLSITRHFRKIIISVTDNGIGISENKLPSLLKPFSRGTDSMQYNYEGIGLGLYTNKIITDKLGGSISISSKLGTGTTTTVTIPDHHDINAVAPVLIAPEITTA